jgi:hypothetical protein
MRSATELGEELWQIEQAIANLRKQTRILVDERRRLRDELFVAQHRDACYAPPRIGAMKRLGNPPIRIVREP